MNIDGKNSPGLNWNWLTARLTKRNFLFLAVAISLCVYWFFLMLPQLDKRWISAVTLVAAGYLAPPSASQVVVCHPCLVTHVSPMSCHRARRARLPLMVAKVGSD